MATVTIRRMYRRNDEGDYLGTRAIFTALDAKGRELTTKSFMGKIGTDEQPDQFTFELGGVTVAAIDAYHMPRTIFEWSWH